MKKIIIGIFVALLLVGCSSDLMEDSYEARASESTNKKQESSNEKARLSVVSNQVDNYQVEYQIIRDNKTNKEYLVVHKYKEGLDVIPLDEATGQTENK
ncbi:MAG: hypothetical protein ACLSVX_01505 [Massilimicrobiota timonensis]